MELINSFVSCFMMLFSIIDILGNLPIIISLKTNKSIIDAKKVILSSILIFLVFLLSGNALLKIIGIDIYSFSIAGSIVLFFISIEMILGLEFSKSENEGTQVSVVPVSFPLIAGPGSLTSLISMRSHYSLEVILLALISNLIIVFLAIEYSDIFENIIGKSGITIMKKIFGIVLLSFSVKILTENVHLIFYIFFKN